MTKGRHQHIVSNYRQQLTRHEKQAEQQLEQAYQHVMRTLDPVLNRLYQDMTNKLNAGEKIPPSWLYEARRLEAIKSLIETSVDHFSAFSRVQVSQLQHWAAQLGQESAMQMLHATVPEGVHWRFIAPDTKAIANIVGATQKGSPLSDLFEGFGREAADGAAKALITGVTMGWNPRQIAPLVMQALGISHNRALTIARTNMIDAYRSSNLETMRANNDVVDQWRWVADKSIRTCSMCLAMDGTLHDLDEDLDSHPNCRCTPVPVTKSWEDILSPLGIDTSGIPETSASADDYQSGVDWFDQQDKKTQLDILGAAKYAAYQAGDITLSSLVYHGHDPDWGGYRQEKSLKAAIGAKKAQKYYANAR